jgi:hypothetical protein
MRHIACTGDITNTYRILVRKPEGKRALKRPKDNSSFPDKVLKNTTLHIMVMVMRNL